MTYTIEIVVEIEGDTDNQKITRAQAIRRILEEAKLPKHATLKSSQVFRDEKEE